MKNPNKTPPYVFDGRHQNLIENVVFKTRLCAFGEIYQKYGKYS